MSLDPDDSRPPYLQVASLLRAAIATGKLKPGEKLPSGNEMAQTYGVARQTVQQALRLLRDDGLIVSRQGSGTFVRARTERPVGLRPHIEAAFEARDVTIDFAGFSGETLANAIAEPLDKIRAGRLTPSSISMRILVASVDQPWGLPRLRDEQGDAAALRERTAGIVERSLRPMESSLAELQKLGLVARTSFEVRAHPTAPQFKLYVLNKVEAFFGFYPVIAHDVEYNGRDLAIWDLLGKDTSLFHHAVGEGDTLDGLFIDQATAWFDSLWVSIARPYAP